MRTRSMLLFLLSILFFIPCSISQVVFTNLTKSNLPKSIKYKGKFIDALQYKDSLGENIIIRSETGIYQTKADIDSGTNSADLYAYRYILKGDSALLAWRLIDLVKQCELDITANFINSAFFLTDLDKDHIAEVWVVSQTSCRGDVSPNTMKIIMYEGIQKYTVKGLRKIQLSRTETLGGTYTFDANFKKGNAVFRDYAKMLWKKNEVNEDEPL